MRKGGFLDVSHGPVLRRLFPGERVLCTGKRQAVAIVPDRCFEFVHCDQDSGWNDQFREFVGIVPAPPPPVPSVVNHSDHGWSLIATVSNHHNKFLAVITVTAAV